MTDLDCRKCGACCAGSDPLPEGTVADLCGEADVRRARRLPVATQERVFVKQVIFSVETLSFSEAYSTGTKVDRNGNVVCAALRGAISNGKARSQCSCSIYESRPAVCRQFPVGRGLCLDARREMEVRGNERD